MIRLIAAIDEKQGLARGGRIPWQLPTDTAYYENITKGYPVVLGKTTYMQIGPQMLASRYPKIYVMSSQSLDVPNGRTVSSARQLAMQSSEDLWVLGGGTVYAQFLDFAHELYITQVEGDFGCDVFFPEFKDRFELAHEDHTRVENGIKFTFQLWKLKPGLR